MSLYNGEKTKARPLGNLVKVQFHEMYNYVSGGLRNPTAAELVLSDPLGLPVKLATGFYELVAAADIANATGILIYDKPITLAADEETVEDYKIMVRGPACVAEDGLPTEDYAGAALNMTNFKAELAALDIVVVEGPPKTSVQTS